MTASELKSLLERVQSWPEAAQDELAAVASEIESGLNAHDYIASQDELRLIDETTSSIDAGESASAAEIKTAFAKFRGT